MSEQRDWYLSMLGINQYRQRLPGEAVFGTAPRAGSTDVNKGAVVNDAGAVAGPAVTPSANPAPLVNADQVMSSLAGLRETLGGEPSAVSPVAAQAPINESTPAAASRVEPKQAPAPIKQQQVQPDAQGLPVELESIHTTLACWQVSDEVLVINGFAHGERANRTQLELLANMMRAIGQLAANLPAAELIEWPVNPGAESTLVGAQTQLSMFLLGRRQVRPYRCLLAMGDDPARLLAKSEGAQAGESDTVETIFLPSLQAMLAEPLCKREVWQALRHLRGG
ncbi:MAG: hypothetical protein KBT88_11670 [Gammaproteobacteria bacterium]|nr:hypothetical protein [Gammaproteobacteria bacterium]MBQ0840434.1 hypothetical protein [Gammaproteobacteria bacterium]